MSSVRLIDLYIGEYRWMSNVTAQMFANLSESADQTHVMIYGMYTFMTTKKVNALASRRHANELIFAQRMDSVEEFMSRHCLPKGMRMQIRQQVHITGFDTDKTLSLIRPYQQQY